MSVVQVNELLVSMGQSLMDLDQNKSKNVFGKHNEVCVAKTGSRKNSVRTFQTMDNKSSMKKSAKETLVYNDPVIGTYNIF